MQLTGKQEKIQSWFHELRNNITQSCENIEKKYAQAQGIKQINNIKNDKCFEFSDWKHSEQGGGIRGLMRGNVFEKIGVNVSTVAGTFSKEFRKKIPGSAKDGKFLATGISIVAHMQSPLIPAIHMNCRYIETTEKSWLGGGIDITPYVKNEVDEQSFHRALQQICDKHDPDYYEQYKQGCDDYFFLKHRGEPRGAGGIFFDYLNSENFSKDFAFVQDIGKTFLGYYANIVTKQMHKTWTREEKSKQLIKRGRYVEFNLLYDRGTLFGLETGGNVEAILMSMPPVVHW